MAVLKNDRLKDKEKKSDTESLLGSLADERFALLVNLGKKITDFGTDEKGIANTGSFEIIYLINKYIAISWYFNIEDNIDETYGINVQFEESEEEDDEDVYGEIREGDDHEDEGEESKLDATIHAENVSGFLIFINN